MMKSRINDVLESYREFVSQHDYRESPILSAYVDIDTTNPDNRKDRPAWLIALKNEASELESQLDQEKLKRRDTQRKWSNTEDIVLHYLQQRKLTGRSVVLFTDHADFVAFDLPVPVQTRLFYGVPQVQPLLFALDQYKKYVVVLVSGSNARVLEVFLTRTTNETRVSTNLEQSGRFGRSGHAHRIESRTEEYERRFTREVARELNQQLLNDPDFERLVLGGNVKQAHAVKNSLHPAIREHVVAVEPIDFKLADNEVATSVREMADRFEMENDLAIVDSLVSRSNRGTAVLERQGVEQALAQHRLSLLVLPYPVDNDELDSLVIDATVAGVDIEFVYDSAADRLKKLGGVGGLTYYAAT